MELSEAVQPWRLPRSGDERREEPLSLMPVGVKAQPGARAVTTHGRKASVAATCCAMKHREEQLDWSHLH